MKRNTLANQPEILALQTQILSLHETIVDLTEVGKLQNQMIDGLAARIAKIEAKTRPMTENQANAVMKAMYGGKRAQ